VAQLLVVRCRNAGLIYKHKLMGFFSNLFGGGIKKHPERDDVFGVRRNDGEMKSAREQVMATLRGFITEVQNPVEGRRYLIKVELKEGKEVEHVWLEPVKWMNPGLAGILAVKPAFITKHKQGDVIAPMPDQRVRGLGPFLGKSNAPRAHCAGGKTIEPQIKKSARRRRLPKNDRADTNIESRKTATLHVAA